MADRYWVGGTASWDGTAGTKWAATSNGPGGASVPTSADDVFFDAFSTGTVTIATGNTGAKSINCTGFTGTIAGNADITVAGSVTLVAGMTFTYSGALSITGTGTITSAGKTFQNVTISGSGITVTLGDAFISNGTLTVTQGTFTTSASNYSLTASILSSNNTNTRTISLNGSTVSLSSGASVINLANSTNLTFNAGTSQINLTSNSFTFQASGQTFYNVAFTGTSTGTRAIAGANTFNNLSVTASSLAGVTQVTFDSRQTINGTLSTTGTTGNRRVLFRGVTYGLAQTLTVNAAPSLTDADFRDIYVIGTAAPISGTRIGNLGGCSGITFSTPKTVYWRLTSGGYNWYTTTNWSLTNSGTGSVDNFPLAQDTAVFSGAYSSNTLYLDAVALPNIDASGATGTLIFERAFGSTDVNLNAIYGSFIISSSVSTTTSTGLVFAGRGTSTITTSGVALTFPITINTYGGTVQLGSALTLPASSALLVTNGNFDTAGYNLTSGVLGSTGAGGPASITLGSSTVTFLASSSPSFSNTNLTVNAGTSQINLAATNMTGGSGTWGNQTYNNVSFTGSFASGGSYAFSGTGTTTFANLTLISGNSTGLMSYTVSNNITVTGTLTCSGATAIRRIFLRSDIEGTSRTITANTLSSTDCDFRDITIAGAAAGSSPTRAGNCGGNSGINFPAPKTVYWNLAGTNNWSATGWAPGSGGTPALNNFPLAQDTAVFDNAGAAGTITLQAFNIGTVNCSSRTSAMTLDYSASATSFYGNYTLGSGVTVSGTATQTFSGRGTQTFTSAGKTITFPITVDTPSGTFQLGDDLTMGTGITLILTRGTFDASNKNLNIWAFVSNVSNTRTLTMGSGTWTLNGTIGNIWDLSTTTGLTFNKNTANIVLSSTATSERTFLGGGLSYNKLTIGGATGTSTLTITGNNQFTELASTKTVAHTIALGTTTQTFGKWTVTGTAGNVVTLTGTGTSHILAGACTSGIDYLAMGSIGFATTSPGEFYAGANSTGTAGAPVYRTAKPADSTRYWVGGTGNWSDTNRWSTGSGGGGGASVPRSHDDVVFDSASNATAYTATVDAVTGGIRCKSLTIAGPLSGNLTLAGSTAIDGIHGNVTLPATGLTRTYTGSIVLSGSSTGRTLTTNGVALGSSITVNGVDCGWTLGSALTMPTTNSPLTITNGTFDTGGFNLTTSVFRTAAGTNRTINFNNSTVSVGWGSSPSFDVSATNTTFNAGTSTININPNSNSGTILFNGNGNTFYNVNFQNTGSLPSPSPTAHTISGENTFNNLIYTSYATTGYSGLTLNNNQTINGTFTATGLTPTQRVFILSNTFGTTRTLTCAAVSMTDVDFRDITIAGAAAPASGTRIGDCKGNSGITFTGATTRYWNLATGGNWSATGWAANPGDAPAVNNFPLAQDTAVFQSTGLNSGATITINAGWNIGTIDMSARTTNTMTLATGTTTPAIYGNWINGTGTTLTGTGLMTFTGRGSQTITSAGKQFTQDLTVNSPSGSVTLQDALELNASRVLTFTSGTFNANNFNVSVGNFTSSNSNIRTLTMGSGTWTILTSGASAWSTAINTNLTVTGTGTISLIASTKTFAGGDVNYSGITLNHGGTGTLTITGNNTFANITNTASGATTINIGTTTQRVANWTAAGTVGNILTVQGTSATSPGTLIYTGAGTISSDYLAITGVRAYNLNSTWYAGANSTNNGSLGFVFSAVPPPAPTATGNFLFFFN